MKCTRDGLAMRCIVWLRVDGWSYGLDAGLRFAAVQARGMRIA
jgi:hypothetical protein